MDLNNLNKIIGFHSLSEDRPTPRVIFEVDIENKKSVFMCVDRTAYMNKERCVVVVDAEKLLYFWRKAPNNYLSDISMGNPATWVKDKKYPGAESGFAGGKKYPVSLADVVCGNDYVAIEGGVTRTIWLLTNGARYFPVECRINHGAERLSQLAGYPGNNIATVENLTG